MPTYSVQVQGNVISLGVRQITIPNIVANTLEEACVAAKAQIVTGVKVLSAQETAP